MRTLSILFKEAKFQALNNAFPRRMYLFSLFLVPFIYSLVAYILFLHSQRPSFLSFVILGAGMMGMWSSIVFSSSADIVRERENRTLELLVASPTPFWLIMVGRLTTNSLLGLLSLAVSLFTVRVICGQPLSFLNPDLFVLALLVTTFTFACLSLLISTAFALSRVARSLQNLIEFPLFLLCGMLFPVEMLPPFVRPLSYLLSPTWALSAMRGAMTGENPDFWVHLLFTLLLSLIYLGAAVYFFNLIERRVRILGTLGSF